MRRNLQETANLVTFTEEIINEKLHLFCRIRSKYVSKYLSKYVFAVLHCLFRHFKIDQKFGKILNIWEGSE